MNWTNSFEEQGWIGEDGYKALLISFLPKAHWAVYHNDQKLAEFDAVAADGIEKAKAFAERHRQSAGQ